MRQSLILMTSMAAAIGVAKEPPIPSGPRLKELAPADGSVPLLIGATFNQPHLGTAAETIFAREFEFLTPGNAFKQTGIHPEPGLWRWKKADQLVEYAAQNGYLMRLHAPVGPQCSSWAEDDRRSGEELLTMLEEYVTAVCKRYNGKPHVRWMDVVNETVTREGEWFGPREGTGRWENPWTKIGFDESHPLRPPRYIKRAFQLAGEHAPDIKLIINQHAGMEAEMWRKVCATALYLRDQGLRIDGIGWQAHVDAGWEKDPENLRRLDHLISWTHRHDLEFHVTENTVWMVGENVDDEAAQAETFAAIVRMLVKHSDDGVVTWNAWQLRDSDPQRPERKGTMFDENGRPKQSYYAVQNVLMSLR
jgi:GH35 family endo-1,4-beta-xylanase